VRSQASLGGVAAGVIAATSRSRARWPPQRRRQGWPKRVYI